MIIFKNTADIHLHLLSKKKDLITTGFVPTMGALHSGHIALVNKARSEAEIVISSIFVNPTQFNDPKDFAKYPSTIENDIYLLEKSGCDILFLPTVAAIYPYGFKSTKHYELGNLETILEGQYRPGHFQGVCQVVHRLLEIIVPSILYLGQKDFQQCKVLAKMIGILGIDTSISVCKTQREPDGLAMSSRNLRLNETERKLAPGIYKALLSLQKEISAGDITTLTSRAKQQLAHDGFKVDYIEFAIADSLEIIQSWDGQTPLVALAAAYLNEIRLIDNILINDLPFKGLAPGK
ncbi:MAG: pantoate--beta-alanine ligase [Ferruginibacter sp.]